MKERRREYKMEKKAVEKNIKILHSNYLNLWDWKKSAKA